MPCLADMSMKFLTTTSYREVVARPSVAAMQHNFEAIVRAPRSNCFVYEVDGAVKGAILGIVTDHLMTGEGVAVEVGWWVEPECRGSNGLRLLEAYEEAVKASGASLSVMTCPPDDSERVGRIYERAGYRKMEATYMKAL